MIVNERLKVAFFTLGCKVNQYETDRLAGQFRQNGYEIVDFDTGADIYVVNTCTVTQIADRKSRKMLHRAKRTNNDATVVAMGCYAQAEEKKLQDDKNIDIIIGNDRKDEAYDIITSHLMDKAGTACMNDKYSSQEPFIHNEHVRAYVKVQDGCNQFCTYCKIPYVRGRLRSRDIEDIHSEIEELRRAGFMEVVLTGIHLSSYGVDKTDKKNFTELNGRILYELIESVSGISGIKRIRLGSLEPRIITESFAERISAIGNLCPHFHLSLQSGCDETLARMNRKYNTYEYREAVDLLRKYFDNPSVTTDIICGFPGETDEEFEKSHDFVKKTGFSMVHVFKYSRRAGTRAYDMPEQVDEAVKNKRSGIMLATAAALTESYAESFIGTPQRCLVEEKIRINERLYHIGHNERYMRLAFEADSDSDIINTIVTVTPKRYHADDILLCERMN